MRIYFLLLSLHFKFITMQEYGDNLWTAPGGGTNFPNDYNGVYTYDKNGFDYNLEYNSGHNKLRRQYQSNFGERNKLATDRPNDSKELYYVFLDKGYPRYMPLNENERPKLSHSVYNINGRDIPMDWPYGDQSKNNYNNKQKRNNRKSYNYDKQRDCHKNPVRTYRPTQMEQKAYATFFDYELENDAQNFPQIQNIGSQQNYKKNLNKGMRYGGNGDNCNQNIKQRFQKNDAKRKQNRSKQVYANNVANIQKNTIHVGTLAQNLVLLGKRQDENSQNEQIGSIQSDKNNDVKCSSSTPKPETDTSIEELLGSNLGETIEPTIKPQTNKPTPTELEINQPAKTEPASNQPTLGEPAQHNKPAITEQSYITIHGGVVKVSPLSDAETQALEDPNVIDLIKQINQLDKVADTGTSTVMPQPLTDSPIYYIQLQGANQPKQSRKPKLPPQVPTQESQAPTLGSGASETPLNSIETDTSPNVPNVEQIAEANTEGTSEAVLTQEFSTAANINLNKNSISSELEQTESPTEEAVNELEHEVDLDNNQDLKPSEDKIYEYVAQMDESVFKPHNQLTQIKHMEPIAYETFLMKPKLNEKAKNKKLTKRYLSKPRRNVQLRALDANRPPRPSKKKKTATTTTTTSTPEINVSKLQFRDSKDDGYKGYPKPIKNSYKRVQVKKAEKTEGTYLGHTKPYKKIDGKETEETQDSQVLGSSSFFTNDEEDPCLEDELETDDEVSINPEELYDDEHEIQNDQSDEFGNKRQELHTAELNNMGRDCDNSNEVSYDGDIYLQNIDTVTPAPLQSFSDLCAN